MGALGIMMLRRGTMNNPIAGRGFIKFDDPLVEEICLSNWDADQDGRLSLEEAAAVNDIGQIFRGTAITSFMELRNFTGVKFLNSQAFSGCTSLQYIDASNVTGSVGEKTFRSCSSLLYANVNNATEIPSTAFGDCGLLENVEMQNVEVVRDWAFSGCFLLRRAEFLALRYIADGAFNACEAMTEFIMRMPQPPELRTKGAFNRTTCVFYVPDESVDVYKSAAVWSNFADRIKPLSEYNG